MNEHFHLYLFAVALGFASSSPCVADQVPQYRDPAAMGLTIQLTVPATASIKGSIPITKLVRNDSNVRLVVDILNGKFPIVAINAAGEHHLCLGNDTFHYGDMPFYHMSPGHVISETPDLAAMCHFKVPGVYHIAVEAFVRRPGEQGATILSTLSPLTILP